MTVFDASAVMSVLFGDPGYESIRALLDEREDPRIISAVNLAELHDVLVRVHGEARERVSEKLLLLRLGGLDVLFVDDVIAEQAAGIRARHYHHQRAPLSMADCIALATARRGQEPLVTVDRALAEAARAEGVEVQPV